MKTLRSLTMYCLGTLAVCTSTWLDKAEAAELPALLQEVTQDHSIAAMAGVLITHYQVAEQYQVGVRALEPNASNVGPTDVWHIGSNGKMMTATLIARLVEQGKLRWDSTLAELLPQYVAAMQPSYRTATIEDLLSHRAGLARNADERWLESTYSVTTDPRRLRQQYVQRVLAVAPVAPIRADANYSNSGTIIAAAIAEQLTGQSFEQLIQREVFQPLQMQVGFGPTPDNANTGHKDGKPIRGAHASNPRVMIPAGDMYMTMQDWARFVIDQMQGEHGHGKLLQQSSYIKLHTPQGNSGSALGFGVRTDFPKQHPVRLLMHAGSNGYWQAVVTMQPDTGKALLLAANAGDGTQAEAYQMQIAMQVFSN